MSATLRSRVAVTARHAPRPPRSAAQTGAPTIPPFLVQRERAPLPPLTLESGVVLPAPALQYTLLGRLNAARDNLVLVTHALTGTPDVHTWWPELIGPGRALDTEHVAVLCANVLGGCYGSTGPAAESANGFPDLSTRDQAAALWALLDTLQVHAPALIVGGSLGGMVALELAALQPARCREVLVLAAPAAQTALGAGWHAIMRTALTIGGAHDGLALARMAGMLSYRAPSGLESRFAGRQQEGTHAVATWLAHHGERLVERFSAGSYRVLIDAMDRHDVARGRGSLADALGPVAERVTGVGIPGDLLYPDDVVRAWTSAIGARYESIVSDHGHDAFLLESERVGTLVSEALARSHARALTSARDGQETRNTREASRTRQHTRRLALAGCGVVGDAVATALALDTRHAPHITRVLVRDVHRARPGLRAATDAALVAPRAVTADPDALLTEAPDVLIEALGGIEPALTLARRGLRRGLHVITANKELVAAHGPELLDLADTHGGRFDFEAAVAAGVPIIRTLRSWGDAPPITRIDAILNGTTNFVLDAISDGATLDHAVRAAQQAGYAEADPSRDLDGRDAEAKVRILGWLAFGVTPRELVVTRRGVDAAVARWTRYAASRGDRVRVIARLERSESGVRADIRPVRVHAHDPWATVRGVGNRVLLHDASGRTLDLRGDGAGGAATARGILADLNATTQRASSAAAIPGHASALYLSNAAR
jgi:homoserine O-acetyltransferase